MTVTKDQVLEAVRALGYDPKAQNVMSVYADTEQIIVRRVEQTDAGWSIVEDVTVLNPNRVPARQRPDGDLGPLVTAGTIQILSPDCRDGNHTKCDGGAWNEVADAPTACQCRDLTHGAAGDPHDG